jgi:hypothetical protein
MSVIPALEWWRQEDRKFEASLGYTVRPCLKKQNKTQKLKTSLACSQTNVRNFLVGFEEMS